MDNCPICSSVFKDDIDKMILAGSNNKHVQQWCKERKFKLTLKAIEYHRLNHLQTVEKVPRKVSTIEPIYLTIGEIEDRLDLGYEELLSYFSTNNIKVNKTQTYDVIEIMRHITMNLSTEYDGLKDEYQKISNPCDREIIKELKNQKLTAQTRLQTAVAELKQIKLQQLQGTLVTSQELEEQWSYSLVGFKAKLEAIPNKVSLELSSIDNRDSVNSVLTKLISEALEELGHESPTVI